MGYYSIVCAYGMFNYSFAGGHLGFFPLVGAIVNNAAVSIAMQVAEPLYLVYLGL